MKAGNLLDDLVAIKAGADKLGFSDAETGRMPVAIIDRNGDLREVEYKFSLVKIEGRGYCVLMEDKNQSKIIALG